jgi:hypothetical protein
VHACLCAASSATSASPHSAAASGERNALMRVAYEATAQESPSLVQCSSLQDALGEAFEQISACRSSSDAHEVYALSAAEADALARAQMQQEAERSKRPAAQQENGPAGLDIDMVHATMGNARLSTSVVDAAADLNIAAALAAASFDALGAAPTSISFATVMDPLCMSVMLAYLHPHDRLTMSAVSRACRSAVHRPALWRDSTWHLAASESAAAPSDRLSACIGGVPCQSAAFCNRRCSRASHTSLICSG